MDRCAVFVDAGYVLADGAMAVHGTRHRDSVSWDYAGLVKLLTGLSRDRTGLPVLRCYWYEATVEGRRSSEHNALADLPGVKLRLGRVRPGRREGVEAEMHRDLATLARNRAVSDAVIVSAEEDLAEVVAEVQDFGLRVLVMHITADGNWTVSRPLRQECDDIVEISGAHLRPFVDLIPGAESPGRDDQYRNGSYPAQGHERRGMANGHGAGLGAVTHQGLPAAALPAPPAIYTAPVVEEYQRTARPPAQDQGPLASPGLPAAVSGPPSSGSHAARRDPAAGSPPAPDQGALPNRAARRDASRDAAGAQDPAGAQTAPQAPLATSPQGAHQAPPQAARQAPAAHQGPGTHQAQDLAQFPEAAPGPARSQGPVLSQGPPSRPAAGPGLSGGYGTQPGDHAGAHVPAHGNPGRRGVPGPQVPAPEAVAQAPVPPPVPPAPAQSAPVPQTPVSLASGLQAPVPPAPVQPNPAQQSPVAQTPVPPAPIPPAAVPRNAVPQNAVPQNPVPQNPVPQAGMPQSAAPGPGETRFGAGPGDYRASAAPGQGAVPAREAMPARDRETTRSAGPAAQFPENAPPGRFAGDPPPGRFADGAPPGRFAEDQAPGRFAESPGPAPYPPAPPGAYGGGGAAQGPYPQFPGPAPGQHAAPGPESGYLGPQHEQGPYSGPQPAAHANLPQPVSSPTTISLTDAVQAAHAEGFGFGDAVARDAPALWLEAVLARKPRMPSDLEARLLQGSALPIDSLLHDEVRQSLRRGFWDALERSRR